MITISELLLNVLLNACWQLALVALAALVCAWLLRTSPIRYRHLLWAGALTLSLLLPAVTVLKNLQPAVSFAPTAELPPSAAETLSVSPHTSPLDSLAAVTAAPRPPTRLGRTLALLLIVAYLLFVAFRSYKLLQAWRRTRALIMSAAVAPPDDRMASSIERCCAAVGVQGAAIRFSPLVPVPVTVGVREPLIILPERLLYETDEAVLTSAIGHELVHVWRRDYFLNIIYEFIYLPLSFHPATALIRRRINQTRELCCDELVAERLLDAQVYARSLVQLAGSAPPLRPLAVTTTVGIADADILEVRIMTLLKRSKASMRGKKLLLLSVSLLLVIPCAAAAAFAFRFGIEPQEPAASTQQEGQTGDEQKKEALKRRALEEKEMQERGIVELKEALQKETDPERRAKLEAKLKRVAEEQAQSEGEIRAFANPAELKLRRAQEEEEMKARQAELARQAKITMDQAIQIATSLNPGKVLECSLIGEHWEAPGKLAKDGMVLYHVVILSPDEANPSTIHVLVNAVDGTILKAEKEMRRKPER